MGLSEKVAVVIGEIREMLKADGGDVELLGVSDEGEVELRLTGFCADCPSASLMTMGRGVEKLLTERVPGITRVVVR